MKLSPKKIKELGNSLKNSYVPNNIPGFSVLVNQDSKEIYYSGLEWLATPRMP